MAKAIKFILYIFKSLFKLIDMIPDVIEMMAGAILAMPAELVGLCTAALTILVIFVIVGRGS